MRFGAVIVAAGMSSRMNDFKQLMEIGDMSLARRVVTNFKRAGVKDITVVTGYRAAEVEKHLKGEGLVFLRNKDYRTTKMSDSARIGFEYLKGKTDGVFLCPVDIPFFLEETVLRMMEEIKNSDIVLPVCDEMAGHPLLIGDKYLDFFIKYRGENGMKGALNALEKEKRVRIGPVFVNDRGTILDTDTAEDFEGLAALHNERLIRPEIEITFSRKDVFFTGQLLLLLKQIYSLGSIREAAVKCNISYSKALKLIDTCEDELGFKVVDRLVGGKNGGGATLTVKCIELIAKFELLEKNIENYARQEFDLIFQKGSWLMANPRK